MEYVMKQHARTEPRPRIYPSIHPLVAVCDLEVGSASVHFHTKGGDSGDFVPEKVSAGHSCSFIDPVSVAAYDEDISGEQVSSLVTI